MDFKKLFLCSLIATSFYAHGSEHSNDSANAPAGPDEFLFDLHHYSVSPDYRAVVDGFDPRTHRRENRRERMPKHKCKHAEAPAFKGKRRHHPRKWFNSYAVQQLQGK